MHAYIDHLCIFHEDHFSVTNMLSNHFEVFSFEIITLVVK